MEFPILKVTDDKVMKNTGSEQRPFWTKALTTRRIRFFGILVFRHISGGNFPDPADKE